MALCLPIWRRLLHEAKMRQHTQKQDGRRCVPNNRLWLSGRVHHNTHWQGGITAFVLLSFCISHVVCLVTTHWPASKRQLPPQHGVCTMHKGFHGSSVWKSTRVHTCRLSQGHLVFDGIFVQNYLNKDEDKCKQFTNRHYKILPDHFVWCMYMCSIFR